MFMTQNISKILQAVPSKRNLQVEYILNLPPEDSFWIKQTVVRYGIHLSRLYVSLRLCHCALFCISQTNPNSFICNIYERRSSLY